MSYSSYPVDSSCLRTSLFNSSPKTFLRRSNFQRHLFFLLALFIVQAVAAQTKGVANKIDPVFRSLLAQKALAPSARKVYTPSAIQPTKGFAYKGAPLEERYNCIVYTRNATALKQNGITVNSTLPGISTAWVTLDELEKIAALTDVRYIQAPREDRLHNDVTVSNSGATLLHSGKLNNTPYKGKGVIVAVFDTGIDWKHKDFRNAGDTNKSRILRIWDQTITATSGEAPPTGYSYGVEYTQTQINNEIDGTPAGFVREKDINGHGTHVAGTAAGNGLSLASRKYSGMAPEADLIIIKGGNSSFPTNNTVDALTYLKGLANTLGKPIVLNMSIGGQFGAHDGSLPHEIAVDDFTSSGPGRVVVISAGNDNGSSLHKRLTLGAGGSGTVSVAVPSSTTGAEVFEYMLYVNGTSNVSAVLTAPSGETVALPAGQTADANVLTNNFAVMMQNLVDPANGNRYIYVYVERNGTNTGDPVGNWNLALTNNAGTTQTIDGWLTYKGTNFSATTVSGSDNNYMVASPGNATSAITVGSYVGRLAWYSSSANNFYSYNGTQQDNISGFSCVGPRRDGVLKPEITAVGQAVISCLSSDATAAASNIAETGLYQVNQGTSMSSPGVAGAVALLLQANPSATAAQVKTLLTNNTTSDLLTGTVPNATWGYGKLNVYKAASSIFNCAAPSWKMLQYDNSFTNDQTGGVGINAQRVAVRFTATFAGKLGGFYYHTAATSSITDLKAEVRTNAAGAPGALLGTVAIPVGNIGKFSWNYVDFSSLNISITNGTDYFVVLYRDAASVTLWSLARENVQLDNRTFLSSDGGTTWAAQSYDYRLRPVVYSNPQFTNALAGTSATDTRNINTSYQFLNNCNLISQVVPTGANPVDGSVASKVWIEPAIAMHNGSPYVARHFEITPAAYASSATGRVTLYFTQAEFDAFNANAGSTFDLPTGANDAAGKANLKVMKFSGTSSDNTGLPATYNNGGVVIDPVDSDIVWNSEASHWEVSFDVTGFSGFIVSTNLSTLPVSIEYLTGKKQAAANLLTWKASCPNGATVLFEIQRSANGHHFTTVGKMAADYFTCASPLAFTDASPLAGNNYYRIKMVEPNVSGRYSSTVLLQDATPKAGVFPTLLAKNSPVQVQFSGARGGITIRDAAGKIVYQNTALAEGMQSINPRLQTSGVYFYTMTNDTGTTVGTGRLVVQ